MRTIRHDILKRVYSYSTLRSATVRLQGEKGLASHIHAMDQEEGAFDAQFIHGAGHRRRRAWGTDCPPARPERPAYPDWLAETNR